MFPRPISLQAGRMTGLNSTLIHRGSNTSRSAIKSSFTRNVRDYAQTHSGRQGASGGNSRRRPFSTMIRGSAIVGLTAAAGYALSLSTQPISADSPSSPSSNETVEQGLSDPSHRILPLTSASASDNSSTQTALSRTPLSALIRTYLVYTFTSLPLIVDYSPSILNALTRSPIPGVSAISEWIVRRTFFDQFVGGDDVKSCLPVMETLRQEEIGTMLVYSVEVEEHGDEAGHEIEGQGGKFKSPEARKEEEDKVRRATEERVEETLRCIRVAGDFERRMKARTGGLGFGGTYVAIKLTGLTPDPTVLHRASTTLLRLRPSTLDSPVHYPSTPTSIDNQVLARPECYTGAKTLENLPRGPSGDGGVLEGEEGLKEGDLNKLDGLWGTLKRVGEAAREEGIKVAVDAEHSWYQPAIDGYTMLLSQEYNKLPKVKANALASPSQQEIERSLPVFYGTYQAYLRRLPAHLDHAIRHAEDNGYVLGVKLVRGAYHLQETKKWKDEGRGKFGKDPIWDDKQSTDKAYDDALKLLLRRISSDLKKDPKGVPLVGAYFGTHNRESCDLVKDRLVAEGLGEEDQATGRVKLLDGVAGRVCTGQLYGMSDELTERVAATYERSGTPMASKYLPYGALREVLPYLGRRAIENKALLSGEGGASAERRRVWAEICRRVGF